MVQFIGDIYLVGVVKLFIDNYGDVDIQNVIIFQFFVVWNVVINYVVYVDIVCVLIVFVFDCGRC